MEVFPVRHHSPASAWYLSRTIQMQRPTCILVEGPSDATPLIPHLIHPDTSPPVAILAYFPAEEGRPPRSALWPFCDYSPEWIALTAGAEVGAEVRFIDAPSAFSLRRQRPRGERPLASGNEQTPTGQAALTQVFKQVARAFNFDSYDEFWEARFEMSEADSLVAAMHELGMLVREQPAMMEETWQVLNQHREACMRREIHRAVEDGWAPDGMLIVCGAAHAPVLHPDPLQDDESLLAEIAALEPARMTIIPYSFLRLSEQVGYGAGNRAPAFYQKVWENELNFEEAVQAQFIELAHAMREARFVVSTADAIEANRLARSLAGLRNKPAPGYYEVQEAAQAVFGRGRPVAPYLTPLLIGNTIGQVSESVERTSIQDEFYSTTVAFGMPLTDAPDDYRLELTTSHDIDASVFLHRLLAAEIPYAHLQDARSASLLPRPPLPFRQPPQDSSLTESAHLLSQLRETWRLQWSPATDLRLIESSLLGNTLEAVCERLYRDKLDEARNMAQASDLLLRIVLARLTWLYEPALEICEQISAHDDDLVAQARAAQNLQRLLVYGSSRAAEEQPIEALLTKVYTRAVLLLPEAAIVGDQVVGPVIDSIKALYDVGSRSKPLVDQALLLRRLEMTLRHRETHPTIHGLCAMLLLMGKHIDEVALMQQIKHHLAANQPPIFGAQFLEGVLALNRMVVLRNPTIVRRLDTYLQSIPLPDFIQTLPSLRRAFSGLSQAELEYLAGTLMDVLRIEETQARQVGRALSDDELSELNQMLRESLGDNGGHADRDAG